MAEVIQSPALTRIIDSMGNPTLEFMIWLDQVTEAVKPPLTGSGSPEGVVVASTGRWYVDTDTTGTGIYLKESGNGDTGWQKRS